MIKRSHLLPLIALSATCCTTTVASELFEPTAQAGPHVIHRLGVGSLRRWWIKGCEVALYAPKGTRQEEILANIPRCLRLHYFHPIRADQFAVAAWDVLQRHFSESEIADLKDQIDALHALYQDVKKGDDYELLYVPGEGTTLSLNGKALGKIKGAAFSAAYFSVWLGEKPLDDRLKSQLLADVP